MKAVSFKENINHVLCFLSKADRAKQIKCNAVINEDPKDKIILSLQEEIQKLRSMMGGNTNLGSMNEIDLAGNFNFELWLLCFF